MIFINMEWNYTKNKEKAAKCFIIAISKDNTQATPFLLNGESVEVDKKRCF